MGIELVTDPETRAPANTEAGRIFYKALEKGLSLKTTNSILAPSPPLIISREELERAFSVVDSCLTEME